MKEKITAVILSLIMLGFSASCTVENVLVGSETTPEGRDAVENMVSYIEGIEPASIQMTPYQLLDKAFSLVGVTLTDDELSQLMEHLMPGIGEKDFSFSYPYVAPADWSVISGILSLTTGEDIAYLNSRLSTAADKNASYGKALADFYELLKYLAGDDVSVADGLISIKNGQELDLADFISVQIVFRFIFVNSFNAIAESYKEFIQEDPQEGIGGYISAFRIGDVLRQFLSKDSMDEILNYYTVLYKLSGSTSIVNISYLSDLIKEWS